MSIRALAISLILPSMLMCRDAVAQAPGKASPTVVPAPPATPPVPGDNRFEVPTPPGSKSDQALWKQGYDVTTSIHIERSRAGRLQLALKNGRYFERLQLMAKPGPEEVTKRAEALTTRLSDTYSRNYVVLTATWPVDPTRGCSYPSMEFGSLMGFARTDQDMEDLGKHRALLAMCIQKALAAVQAMTEANESLSAAMEMADGALAGAGLGAPTAGLPATTGAPAASTGGAEAKDGK